MDKKRRYEIQTNVRIPDMEEIRLAAANYKEPVETEDAKADSNSKGFATQRVRRLPKYEAQLSSIKNEMEALANKVAIEEQEKEAEQAIAAALIESEAREETVETTAPEAGADEKQEIEDTPVPLSDPLLESVAAVVKTTMEKKKTETPKKLKNKPKE